LVAAYEIGARFACVERPSLAIWWHLSSCVHQQLTFLLCRTRRDDNNIALSSFSVLGSAYASACVAVVSGIAEVLYLSIAELGLGIYEQDLAGDLVVLFNRKVSRSVDGIVAG
jgi:hypothetical protein